MTHADVISRWPTIAAFADDIECAYEAAKAMRRRSAIPAGYWLRVVEKAAQRGIDGVSLQVLAQAVAMPSRMEAAE